MREYLRRREEKRATEKHLTEWAWRTEWILSQISFQEVRCRGLPLPGRSSITRNLLLADEPTGALDSKSGAQVMELFQRLNDEGVSVLMITHDADIAAHAKRVVTIKDGILQEKR